MEGHLLAHDPAHPDNGLRLTGQGDVTEGAVPGTGAERTATHAPESWMDGGPVCPQSALPRSTTIRYSRRTNPGAAGDDPFERLHLLVAGVRTRTGAGNNDLDPVVPPLDPTIRKFRGGEPQLSCRFERPPRAPTDPLNLRSFGNALESTASATDNYRATRCSSCEGRRRQMGGQP